MSGLPAIVDIPLSIDAYGAIRVSGTRVLLDVIPLLSACSSAPSAQLTLCVTLRNHSVVLFQTAADDFGISALAASSITTADLTPLP